MKTRSISETYSNFKMPNQYSKSRKNLGFASKISIQYKNDDFTPTNAEKKSNKGKVVVAAAIVGAGAALLWALKTGKFNKFTDKFKDSFDSKKIEFSKEEIAKEVQRRADEKAALRASKKAGQDFFRGVVGGDRTPKSAQESFETFIKLEDELTQNAPKKVTVKKAAGAKKGTKKAPAKKSPTVKKTTTSKTITPKRTSKKALQQQAINEEALRRTADEQAALRMQDLSQTAYKAAAEKNLSGKSAQESFEVFTQNQNEAIAKLQKTLNDEIANRETQRLQDLSQTAYKAAAEKNLSGKSAKESFEVFVKQQDRAAAKRLKNLSQFAYKTAAEKNLSGKSAQESFEVFVKHQDEIAAEALRRTADAKAVQRLQDLSQTAYRTAFEKNFANKSAQESFEAITQYQDELLKRLHKTLSDEQAARRLQDLSQTAYKAAAEKNLANKSAQESANAILAAERLEVAEKLRNALNVPNIPLLPEKSSKTIAEIQKEAFLRSQQDNKFRSGLNFALATFGVGGLLEAGRQVKKAQDGDDEELQLKELILKHENNLKNNEASRLLDEARALKYNYEVEISSYLPKINANAGLLRGLVDEFEQGNFEGENTTVQTDANGVKYVTLLGEDDKKICAISSKDGKAQAIELYDDEGDIFSKGLFRKQISGGNNYMSHYIKYDKKTAQVAGTIVYDEQNNPKSYLSRDINGGLNKIFIIDPDTFLLKRGCLTDDGKKCTRKYEFDKNGNLEKVCLDKTEKMPKRDFLFKDGVAVGLDVYGSASKNLPLFNVEFN